MQEPPARPRRAPRKSPAKPPPSTLGDALAAAFGALGGVEYLLKLARDDPKTFCALLTRALPGSETLASDKDITLAWQSPEEPPPAA